MTRRLLLSLSLLVALSGGGIGARAVAVPGGCIVASIGLPPYTCSFVATGTPTRFMATATGWDITVTTPHGSQMVARGGPTTIPSTQVSVATGEINPPSGADVTLSLHSADVPVRMIDGFVVAYTYPANASTPANVFAVGGDGDTVYVPGPFGYPAWTELQVWRGESLTFTNLAAGDHSVTADVNPYTCQTYGFCDPAFDSGVVASGSSAIVKGVENLPSGDYGFHCTVHPNVRGILIVS